MTMPGQRRDIEDHFRSLGIDPAEVVWFDGDDNVTGMISVMERPEAARWDQMKWGNPDGFIPDSDPDWSVPLTTLPSKTWQGMTAP